MKTEQTNNTFELFKKSCEELDKNYPHIDITYKSLPKETEAIYFR